MVTRFRFFVLKTIYDFENAAMQSSAAELILSGNGAETEHTPLNSISPQSLV